MKFEEQIQDKIDALSFGQKKVGGYILAHLEESSYSTLARISRESGVSETTVIRFAYTLGYESFSAMQNFLRNELLGGSARDRSDDIDSNLYQQTLDREIAALERTKKILNEEGVEDAAQKLHHADRVLSVAGRTMYASAMWFAEILGKYREGVYAVRPVGEEFFTRLLDVSDRTVVVAVSFARYSQSTLRFVKMAKERGAFIIAITDNPLCMLATLADQVFITESNKDESGINTISSAAALLNVLAVAVRRLDLKKVSSRLKELELLYQQKEDVLIE